MYTLKIVNKDGKERFYPCDGISKEVVSEDSYAAVNELSVPGIVLDLLPRGPRLHLPTDGVKAYLMAGGDTIDSWQWPLKSAPRRVEVTR